MKLCLINHNFRYEIEKLIRLFMPFEKIEFYDSLVDDDVLVVTEIKDNTACSFVNINGKTSKKTIVLSNVSDEKETELKLSQALYFCMCEITNYKPSWGMLTGIRPTKLYSRLISDLGGEANADRYLTEELKIDDKKLSLCKETHLSEEKIISLSTPRSFSLYVSIPFCPTRCSYCSFVSHSVEKSQKLIPEYLEKLFYELKITGEIAHNLNLKLETIYIGGGTPTTLTAEQLENLMTVISDNFDLSDLKEYTVEAGRPDTITKEKLLVIKKCGATRISINPQTMNDDVLKVVGRQHSSLDTINAFALARECGHDNINMDLIAGLPTDTFESFKATLSMILELSPESVTVHSLSMKRSSTLTKNSDFPEIEVGIYASQMVDYAREVLTSANIKPYYMYRQSKTVGNLENIGYSKPSFESLYNVYIMDETHTILACGASAVTKLKSPYTRDIERIFNYKYPYEYISNFTEMIARKEGIVSFYEKYSI